MRVTIFASDATDFHFLLCFHNLIAYPCKFRPGVTTMQPYNLTAFSGSQASVFLPVGSIPLVWAYNPLLKSLTPLGPSPDGRRGRRIDPGVRRDTVPWSVDACPSLFLRLHRDRRRIE